MEQHSTTWYVANTYGMAFAWVLKTDCLEYATCVLQIFGSLTAVVAASTIIAANAIAISETITFCHLLHRFICVTNATHITGQQD